MSDVYNAFTMAKTTRPLLIATGNKGKLREFRGFLRDVPIEIIDLSAFDDLAGVPETGLTFAANARVKALGYALQTGHVTLADDSGLELMALNGRPGVLSARYGGVDAPFSTKMSMLLDELSETGASDRRARFFCAVAVADESGEIIHTSEGICNGTIAAEPRGEGGFGYDPLFIPDGFDQTFGELNDTVKAKISQRATAFLKIVPFLRGFFAI